MVNQYMNSSSHIQTKINQYVENMLIHERIHRANILQQQIQLQMVSFVNMLYTDNTIKLITSKNPKYKNSIKSACALITYFPHCINKDNLYDFQSFETKFNKLISNEQTWNIKFTKLVDICNDLCDSMLPYTGANMIIDNISLVKNITVEELYCTINDLTPVLQVVKLTDNTALIWCLSVSEAYKYANKINGKILCDNFIKNTYTEKDYLKCSFILTKIDIWKEIYSYELRKSEICFYDVNTNSSIPLIEIIKISSQMREMTKNDIRE